MKKNSLFIVIVLIGLIFSVVNTTQAHNLNTNDMQLNCPPFNRALLKDKAMLQEISAECFELYRGEKPTKTGLDMFALATGGPDVFGYTYDDTVSYNWVSAATDSGVTGNDEVSGAIDIGFDFPFYGLNYSQLYFNTNGLITLGIPSNDYYSMSIPYVAAPNNFIAAFWSDLIVGVDGNAGAIYYTKGGSAPNRYIVVEWRDVQVYPYTGASSPFSFEAILYENGNILIQTQSLPDLASSDYTTIGVEDSLGKDGLEYYCADTVSGLTAPKAILFSYPTTSTVRTFISPTRSEDFTFSGQINEFDLKIGNTGSSGSDTYDLVTASTWDIALYAADGATLLTDTDSDGIVDTGSISQGDSVIVVAKITSPVNAQMGDGNTAIVTTTSSLDISKSKTISLITNVPSSFVNVFGDFNEQDVSFMTIDEETGKNIYHFSEGDHYSDYHAVEQLPNGNYIYAWERYHTSTEGELVADIEYVIVGKDGNAVSAVKRLTDNSNATTVVRNHHPSVAAAPDGTIGVFWDWYTVNALGETNYNFYFATLDTMGNLLSGPTKITDNTTWLSGYYWFWEVSTTLVATDDNYFILGWDTADMNDIYYSIRSTENVEIAIPQVFFLNGQNPIFNGLKDGKVIATWETYSDSKYTIIDSSIRGYVFNYSSIPGGLASLDAVLLPNGKTVIAWTIASGVSYVFLDELYEIEGIPISTTTPGLSFGYRLSVTTDSSSNVIMTWTDSYGYGTLMYAVVSGNGTVITPPMIYYESDNIFGIGASENGQGNAPWDSHKFSSSNDDFNFAENISALNYRNESETFNATVASDDPVSNECYPEQGTATVWYKYTPTAASAISIDTLEASYDTFVAVWTGTRGDLTLVACNDDVGNTKQSAVAFRVQNGTTYYIEVGQP